MPPDVKLGVWGASGRLGSRIVALAQATPGVKVVAAWVRPGSDLAGQPVPGVEGVVYAVDAHGVEACDVLVDVSLPDAVPNHVEVAVKAGKALLMGATGLPAGTLQQLNTAAITIPVCVAPNLSTGVWVLAHLVKQASHALAGADVEIVETHHRHKKDAPSGTAMLLAQHVAAGRGVELASIQENARTSVAGPRKTGSLGMSSVRGGDVVGDHTVFILADGERLELTHRAHSRDTFAHGALSLAAKMVGRAPGMLSVPQLLGLAG